jgi:hypothetical protein
MELNFSASVLPVGSNNFWNSAKFIFSALISFYKPGLTKVLRKKTKYDRDKTRSRT